MRKQLGGGYGSAAGNGEDGMIEPKCWRERREVHVGWEGAWIEAKVA